MQEEMKTIRENLNYLRSGRFGSEAVVNEILDDTLTALDQLEARQLVTTEELDQAIATAYDKGKAAAQKEWQEKLDSEEFKSKLANELWLTCDNDGFYILAGRIKTFHATYLSEAAIKAIKE